MLPQRIGSTIIVIGLLPFCATAQPELPRGESVPAPQDAVDSAVYRADLKEGKLVATAVEPAPLVVQTPTSLSKKAAPKEPRLPRKLHPRLLKWIKERDPGEIEKVVIAFEDSLEIPRFPDLDPNFPREAPENRQVLATAEALVRELREKRIPAYNRRRQQLSEYRAEVVETFWLVNAVTANMPLGHVLRLAQLDDVVSIVPDDSGEPPPRERDGDSKNDVIEGRRLILSDPYFAIGLNKGYIGLLDSGVRFTHSLFKPPAKIDLRLDCINGGESCNRGPSVNPVDDCQDHGTATAAILIANDREPNERFRGVTAITLDSFKVYPSTFDGRWCTGLQATATSRAFAAAVAALDKVIVAEVQGGLEGRGVISLAANAAFDAGAVVVAANGNYGSDCETTSEPASASRALGVGAFDLSTGNTIDIQSRGPTEDGRIKPDIQAPTATETASNGCGTSRCDVGSDVAYQIYDGTSGATPYAAGAAALIRNFVGRGMGRRSVDPGLVYALMILSGQKADFDNERGAGPIRLPTDGTLRWGTAYVHDGEELEIPIVLDAPQKHLDAALWWPEDGVQSRHNNIDLMIVDPGGMVRSRSASVPSVFERARFQGAMLGRWSVRIQGSSVNSLPPQKVYFAILDRETPMVLPPPVKTTSGPGQCPEPE